MEERARCLALDFGASSIRLVDAWLADGRLGFKELARFANGAMQAGDQIVWDYDSIYSQVKGALKAAGASGVSYASIGADSWGVDYVLLNGQGEVIGPAVSYRDPRTDGMIERYSKQHHGDRTLFEVTGLPALPFNTLFQLYAQHWREPDLLRGTHRLLFTADYANYWLSGVMAVERTLCSTSQMLMLDGTWWPEAVEAVGLPAAALSHPVPAGTVLGSMRADLATETGLTGLSVIAPATHDTQSAILAVPAEPDEDWAYLSSGTWSILGIESETPFNSIDAEAAGLGNESGYGGTYCVQTTVTGLWLIQEIERLLGQTSARQLSDQAERAQPFRSLVNPADPRFFHPANMITEIKSACHDANEPEPHTIGELVRCAYDSLALLYRKNLSTLAAVTGRHFTRLHIVGGGSMAMLLNRICAAATGIPVIAGPAEATAIGNCLAQMIALGAISGVPEARRLVRESFPRVIIEPIAIPGLENAIRRFELLSTPKR